jgi:hypothetical protein
MYCELNWANDFVRALFGLGVLAAALALLGVLLIAILVAAKRFL